MLINSNFNPEYVIVMDMDDIGSDYLNKYINFINYSITIKPHWDAIFPKVTYDLWAFRTKNCTVNYTPTQYQTFRPMQGRKGAPPIEIEMKLDFQETKLITKEDVLEGY